jgi:hypothetical protein
MSSRKPPKVFFDRCFGGQVLRERLVESGFEPEIVLHDDLFPKTAEDLLWTQWAAEQGAVAFTCDLFRNQYQRQALESFPGVLVIFPELPIELMRGHIHHAWPKILHLVTNGHAGCYRYSVTTGRLSKRWK